MSAGCAMRSTCLSPGITPGPPAAPSQAEHRRDELLDAVEAVHAEASGRYRSPWMHAELKARVFGQRGGEGDARFGHPGENLATVDPDDRLAARAAGGRERPRQWIRAGRPGHCLAGRYHVRPDGRGVAVPRARPGPVQSGDRGVGDRRRRAGRSWKCWTWRCAAGGRGRGSWPTRTGGASPPAGTTSGCWAKPASRAPYAVSASAGITPA